MKSDKRRLVLVASDGEAATAHDAYSGGEPEASRDLDWTILMARAQDGDTVAYLRLLQEITPYLRSLARRWHKDQWDVEDTVQDILLTVHSIRQTYDPSRPFGPWLVGIANRRAIDRLRRRSRQTLREAPLSSEHEAAPAEAGDAETMIDRQNLSAAIGGLPPIQRQAVDMLKLKEMSLKEVSEATGLSIASLKMATHRAIQNLRAILTDRKGS